MKIGVIMAVVSFPLMKLITETTFNLFKTFKLYWIAHLTNLISFQKAIYLQNSNYMILKIFSLHKAYFAWQLGYLQILKHCFVLASLQNPCSILQI